MPTEALVIVRVHDVRENAKISFFAEPWKLYVHDMIEFKCEATLKGRPVNPEQTS
jgi:hypothetical protein